MLQLRNINVSNAPPPPPPPRLLWTLSTTVVAKLSLTYYELVE